MVILELAKRDQSGVVYPHHR